MDVNMIIEKLIETSPALALVALIVWLNHKMMLRWFVQVEETFKEHVKSQARVSRALGEVTEALRRLNGKKEET